MGSVLKDKENKKFYEVLTKTANVFTDFYVVKNGYMLSMSIDKPFVIQLDDIYIEKFEKLCGGFKIIRVTDLKNFKKSLTVPAEGKEEEHPKLIDCFYIVTDENEQRKVVDKLSNDIKDINKCEKWEKFILSNDDDENTRLLLSLFKDNNYINFSPKDTTDGPDIILTKSLLPLVSDKNYTDLFYSSKKISSDLYLIVFDFNFNYFRLYMLHHYIPISK